MDSEKKTKRRAAKRHTATTLHSPLSTLHSPFPRACHALCAAGIALVALLGSGRPARADTLVTTEGRSYEGRVIYEDDKVVKFKIGVAVITFKRSEIKDLQITQRRVEGVAPLRSVGDPKKPGGGAPAKPPGSKPPATAVAIGPLKVRKLSPATLKALYGKLAEGPGRADALLKCEALVNLYLAEADKARRAEIVRRVEGLGLPPVAVEAVVRRGRHYEVEPTGDVRTEVIIRKTGTKGDVILRVPRDYDPRRAYPLLVALHAGGGRADSALRIWGGLATARGYIVAAPQAAAPGNLLGRTRAGWSNVLSAIDMVQARYRIDPDRVYCEGLSMGGRASWDMALNFSDRVAAIASRSGPVPLARGAGSAALAPSPMLANAGHVGLFLIHGDADELVDVSLVRQTVGVLKKLRADYVYREIPAGGHEAFAKLNAEILDFFKAHTRPSVPKSLSFVTNDPDVRKHYWIEIARFAPGPVIDASLRAPSGDLIEQKKLLVRPASVEARLADGNVIRLQTRGVTAVKVYLNRRLVDFRKPVRIYLNGRLRHNAKLTPSAASLLENARLRHRRDFIFPAAVSVGL